MKISLLPLAILSALLCLPIIGCMDAPGRPRPGAETYRPDQISDFPTLYKQNCAACHGNDGKNGAAISLSNPVYIATAGVANMQRITSNGISGTLMPAFGRAAGGMLTDAQIAILAYGVQNTWGRSGTLSETKPIPYASVRDGDVSRGQAAFATFCASCHGVDGTGGTKRVTRQASIVDPTYLALISDQGLRSIVIAGNPELGMPDWRSDISGTGNKEMTDQEVTDVVTWMASHRIANPGQPYPTHSGPSK